MPSNMISREDKCLTTRDGSPWLVGSALRQPWNCCVCQALLRWRDEGYETVLFQEVQEARAAYIFPVRDAVETRHCVLAMRIQGTPLNEIRWAMNALALGSQQLWIFAENPPACELLVRRVEGKSETQSDPAQEDSGVLVG